MRRRGQRHEVGHGDGPAAVLAGAGPVGDVPVRRAGAVEVHGGAELAVRAALVVEDTGQDRLVEAGRSSEPRVRSWNCANTASTVGQASRGSSSSTDPSSSNGTQRERRSGVDGEGLVEDGGPEAEPTVDRALGGRQRRQRQTALDGVAQVLGHQRAQQPSAPVGGADGDVADHPHRQQTAAGVHGLVEGGVRRDRDRAGAERGGVLPHPAQHRVVGSQVLAVVLPQLLAGPALVEAALLGLVPAGQPLGVLAGAEGDEAEAGVGGLGHGRPTLRGSRGSDASGLLVAMPKTPAAEVDAGGRAVRVSSPDRVIYEATDRTPEVTKLMVAEYFASVDDGLMRALRDRPTALERWTSGVRPGMKLATEPGGPGRRRVLPEAGAQGRARLPGVGRDHLPLGPEGRGDLPDRDRGAGVVRPHGHAHLPPLAGPPQRRGPARRAAPRPRPAARDVVHRRGAGRRGRPRAARGAGAQGLPQDVGQPRRARLRPDRAEVGVHRRPARRHRLRPRAGPPRPRRHRRLVEGGAR